MRTKKTIRASFSAEPNTVNVELPKSWADLSQDELAMVYRYMAAFDGQDVRLPLFMRFAGLRPSYIKVKDGDKRRFVVEANTNEGPRKFTIYLSPMQLAGWLDQLNWLAEPGATPVRLESIGDAYAVNAQFHGVSFKAYYMVENYFQGYIASQNRQALQRIEALLYPGVEQSAEMEQHRALNILNWVVQVKTMFARTFSNFFRPASGTEMPNMAEVMNNQIRALTGGDVTKEEYINNIDCWRALTELDFKAKEAEELRRIQSKRNQ